MTKLLADRSTMVAMPDEAGAFEPSDSAGLSECHAVSLRFELKPEDADHFAERLDRSGGLCDAIEKIRGVYLDTPEYAIAALGLGFGIRQRSKMVVVAGHVTSDAKRRGWKRFVEPLSAATPISARRMLKSSLRDALAIDVVARVETQSHVWSVACGESQAQIVLDRSTVLMNGKEVTLASVRFACDAANADFFRLVPEVCEADRLRLNAESDLARAYRLCGGPSKPYVTAFAPDLDANMDAAAAFRTIATACFDQFLLNETAVRATADPEAVHQCRVALRRLSACLRFFSGFIDGADYEAVRAELKELGTHLRTARDLDVMIADVIAPALAADPPSGATTLMREIEARRSKAYADLVATLRATSSVAFFLRFVIWLEAGDWTRSADPKSVKRRCELIARYACRKFGRMSTAFAERCAELGQMEKEERHRTRIHAKNLRYDAEFFETLVRGKTAKKRRLAFIQAVKTLQTTLGDWNDVLMARQFLMSLAEEADTETDPKKVAKPKPRSIVAVAASALARRIEETPESLFGDNSAAACTALTKVKPFWTRFG